MIRSKKITEAARGEQCTLQIAGHCHGDTDSVVFCHFPDESHGISLKSDDISGGFGCYCCHQAIDLRQVEEEEREWYMRRSQTRTMRRLFELGVLKIA